jgi:aldehyde dehydrogenase (NAD+)
MYVSSVVSKNSSKFFIDGAWVNPIGRGKWEVVNLATEDPVAEIALGTTADVDRAVAAAQAAFRAFARIDGTAGLHGVIPTSPQL